MNKSLGISLLALILVTCTREVTVPPTPDGPSAGRLVINEIAVNGDKGDWIEVYNPGPALTLEAGFWFITDDPTKEPLLFELPELEAPAEGHLVIWCDADELTESGVHAGFGIGKRGADLALFWSDGSRNIAIDHARVDGTTPLESSYGRFPDGTMQWGTLLATPGSPNGETTEP